MSTPLKFLLGFAILFSVVMMVFVGATVYMLIQSPDTFVYTGPQMKKAHVDIVRELGLLNDGEEIQYFYSDGFFDIKKGLYFVTGERLVLYSENWAEPSLAVPFDRIVDAEVVYDESFFIDSMITITLDDGEEWSFPVSSERGRDKDFFEHIDSRRSHYEETNEPAA